MLFILSDKMNSEIGGASLLVVNPLLYLYNDKILS